MNEFTLVALRTQTYQWDILLCKKKMLNYKPVIKPKVSLQYRRHCEFFSLVDLSNKTKQRGTAPD